MPPRRKKKKSRFILIMILLMVCSPLLSLLYQLTSLRLANVHDIPSNNSNPGVVPSVSKKRIELTSIVTVPQGEVVGDPQFLLDVAIVGFPKCGTTALQDWLSQHSQIQMLPGEPFPLMYQKPYLLIWKLYRMLPEDGPAMRFVRGYKNPLDIRCPRCMNYLATLFPKTLLIVGLRHPVLWFESLYNFKIQNLNPKVHPGVFGDPNELVNQCEDFMDPDCVGTAKGWFHVHLAALGKVPFPDSWRDDYPRYLQNASLAAPVPNKVFLYETNQLVFDDKSPVGASHAQQFRNDLKDLLHLDSPLTMPMSRAKPDNYYLTLRQQQRKDKFKIQICDEKYKALRNALMDVARRSSNWIREEFLQSPDVIVSSREYFVSLMEKWMEDPCKVKAI